MGEGRPPLRMEARYLHRGLSQACGVETRYLVRTLPPFPDMPWSLPTFPQCFSLLGWVSIRPFLHGRRMCCRAGAPAPEAEPRGGEVGTRGQGGRWGAQKRVVEMPANGRNATVLRGEAHIAMVRQPAVRLHSLLCTATRSRLFLN